jgi:serine O-acetyltransferase
MQLASNSDDPIDHTWELIQTEARAMAHHEPFLAPVLKRALQEPQSLQEALARKLAEILATRDLPEKDCYALFCSVLQARPSIAVDTARDLAAVQARDPACTTQAHAFLNYKGFQAVQAQRIAHWLWRQDRKELASWLTNRAALLLGPDIHPAAQMGAGIMLDHGAGIVIGETAVVEDDVSILQNVTLGGTGKITGDRHPKVRRGVMIGAGAAIIGNVEIGALSKVAAGSVVLKDVPPNCTVAGIPAQIVRIHQTSEMPSDKMDQSY